MTRDFEEPTPCNGERWDPETDDIVVAVMGPTGSGKSTFIRRVSGYDDRGIGHELHSCTKGVLPIRFRDRQSGHDVVLVDTPGFDNTLKSDLDILNMVSDWLNTSYKKKLLSSILYLHRISYNRVAGTPLKNLRLFRKLCGEDALDKVYLITTMWDEVDQSTGERSLKELREEHWKPMIDQGTQVACCRNDDDSMKNLVQQIVGQEATRKALRLQREIADQRRELIETEVVQELCSRIENLIERQLNLLNRIDAERKAASDPNVLAELQAECSDLRVQIDDKLRQMQELKSSWLQTLARLLSPKRSATGRFPPQTYLGRQFQVDPEYSKTAGGPPGVQTPTTIEAGDLGQEDVVIAVIGPTGAGKSSLVHLASGHDIGISHSLTSGTQNVLAVKFRDQDSDQDVVLLDTPGLDNMIRSDDEIWNMISDWLTASSKRATLVSGILYLHRITDNRTTPLPLKRLRELCGDDTSDKVYLTTTMWDEVEESTGESRVKELKTLIGQQARIVKSQNNKDSVRKIIQQIVIQEVIRKAMRLQHEMADLRKHLRETQPVQKLYSQLQDLVKKQRDVLQMIDTQMQASSGGSLEVLWRDYNELRVQISDKLDLLKELRMSWFEYLFRAFSRK